MSYDIRLGATLSFDETKERDLIQFVEGLTERHKLGEFIAYLIRECYDNPNLSPSTWSKLGSVGITPDRGKFFTSVSRDVDSLKRKVDEMYDMNLRLITLAKFGKRLGLLERTNSMLQANFLIQDQINQLCSMFGVSNISHVFASNKIEEAHLRADATLAYILESYDGIVAELQGCMVATPRERIVADPPKAQLSAPVKAIKKRTDTDEIKVEIQGIKPDLAESQINMLQGAGDEMDDLNSIDTSALDSFLGA